MSEHELTAKEQQILDAIRDLDTAVVTPVVNGWVVFLPAPPVEELQVLWMAGYIDQSLLYDVSPSAAVTYGNRYVYRATATPEARDATGWDCVENFDAWANLLDFEGNAALLPDDEPYDPYAGVIVCRRCGGSGFLPGDLECPECHGEGGWY